MQKLTAEEVDKLIRAHKDAVYRQLYRMCGSREDAEDVLSESLMRAYRAIGQLEDPEKFRGWLVQIGRRTCGKLKKKESLAPLIALAEEDLERLPAPDRLDQEDRTLEQELKSCLLSAYESLPTGYQDAYRLRDIDGLTAEQASAQLGITIPNLKSRLHRARAALRAAVDRSLINQ